MRYQHGFVIMLIMLLTLAACQRETVIQQIRPVRAEQIKPFNEEEQYSYAGVVGAHENVALAFQVNGKILHRYVEIGDSVKVGQLLMSLDTKDLSLDEQNLEQDVKSAQSELDVTKSDLDRYKPLAQAGYITKSFYQQQVSKYTTDSDSFAKAKNLLGLAKRRLEYAKLYAEYPGIIVKILANEGQVISAGQEVMEMARSDDKEIVINVPEQRIQEWQHINKAIVMLWAYPDKKYIAKIREIAGEADASTRTYTVKLSIHNMDAMMQLGMTANVQVMEEGDIQHPIIALPLTAISYETRTPFVWIINMKNMTVQPVAVKLGNYQGNKIIVTSGLHAGQWVVTAGVNSLRPGQKIKLLEEQ